MDHAPDTPRTAGLRGPERLEAFSDGVFAIAITLLVLEIRVPASEDLVSNQRLVSALGALWPSYLGYVISFVTIGIMWANHHNLFRLVASVSHGVVVANLLLLLGIGFVPFPTALLAGTLATPSQGVGVIFYAGTFVGIAFAFNLLWYQVRHGPEVLCSDADSRAIDAITRSYRLGPPGYLIALLGALISPAFGVVLLIVLAGLYLLPSSTGA